ncbi:MAG TPA: hypothetical protein VI932_12430 [Bacteroidota bacterium]|nr:hypothetical protein [Bacteroidota bacterium]
MLERTFSLVGLQFAKFQFRSDFDTPQNMTNFFTGAKNVLVAMPRGYDNAVHAGNALHKYRDALNHLHLTIIHTGTRETNLSSFLHSQIIRITPADINTFSLPTRGLMQRIFLREYDVALDLNLDFVLHSAYICKASRARVRVGFQRSPLADLFFNVKVELTERRAPQSMYEHFAACLMMF